MSDSSAIVFYINEKKYQVSGDKAFLPLSTFLRDCNSMVGTKVVCEEGDCGACTVLLGKLNQNKELEYLIIDSCIQFIFQLHLCHIVTVEGLTSRGSLCKTQEAMVEHFGSQCGFCTPGFVMSIFDLASKEDVITAEKVRNKLTGNLCRCTGYTAIIDSCLSLNDKKPEKIADLFNIDDIGHEFINHADVSLQTSGLMLNNQATVLRPANLEELLELKAAHPEAKLVAGATDLGVQINKGRLEPTKLLTISHLYQLKYIKKEENFLEVGALTNWESIAKQIEKSIPEFYNIIQVFASEQIKNAATIAGNIANGSPIADSLPFLYVIDAEIVALSSNAERVININNFYTGYKQLDLKADEIISAIRIPLAKENDKLKLYKVSKRHDLDISTFTAAILLSLESNRITSAKIALGGVGANIVRLPKTEEYLVDNEPSEHLFREAGTIAASEISPISDVRASKEYRLQLAKNILLKYYFTIFSQEGVVA